MIVRSHFLFFKIFSCENFIISCEVLDVTIHDDYVTVIFDVSHLIIIISMNPKFDLNKGMEDFSCLLERVGLLRLTQADTERVVKTIRKIEPRFPSFNEVKEAKGARDRAQQEIFLCENKVALQELPLDELFDAWTQTHYPTLKKKAGNSKSVDTFFKKDFSSAKFMSS